MPKTKGTYIAHRNREIQNSRRGTSFKAAEVAYIPSTDPDGFPALMKVSAEVFSDLEKLAGGEQIELQFIETPPYGDNLVTACNVLALA